MYINIAVLGTGLKIFRLDLRDLTFSIGLSYRILQNVIIFGIVNNNFQLLLQIYVTLLVDFMEIKLNFRVSL